jgi:hypothetical protein
MPRDASVTMKLFMVDVRTIRKHRLVCTQGPFSEQKAQRVCKEIDREEPPQYYGDIRRAREEERER